MRLRIEIKEDEARIGAKVSVLQALVERTRRGEDVRVEEVRREFEMVGLRQRRGRGEEDGRVDAKDVGWREAIFGRRQRVGEGEGAGESEVEMKEQDLGAWAAEGEPFLASIVSLRLLLCEARACFSVIKCTVGPGAHLTVMREDSPKSPISAPTEGARSGVARRASNTKVFL